MRSPKLQDWVSNIRNDTKNVELNFINESRYHSNQRFLKAKQASNMRGSREEYNLDLGNVDEIQQRPHGFAVKYNSHKAALKAGPPVSLKSTYK